MIDCGSIDIGSIPVIHSTNFIREWNYGCYQNIHWLVIILINIILLLIPEYFSRQNWWLLLITRLAVQVPLPEPNLIWRNQFDIIENTMYSLCIQIILYIELKILRHTQQQSIWYTFGLYTPHGALLFSWGVGRVGLKRRSWKPLNVWTAFRGFKSYTPRHTTPF